MDKKDWDKSIKLTFIALFGMSLFWFLFSCQLLWAYDPGGAPLDLKKNSRVNDTLLIQPGTGTSGGSDTARFRIFYGTQACVGVGSNGYILSGTLTGLPFVDYLYGNGSSTINFSGFTHVAIGGSDIPSSSSVNGKIDAVAGTGTANVFTDTTLAGSTTIGTNSTITAGTTTFAADKVQYLADVSEPIEAHITTVEGSVNTHDHKGTNSVTIAHADTTGIGANDHHNQVHGASDHSGNIGAEAQITFETQSGHTHNGVDSTKIDYATSPVRLGTDTSGNTDNIIEGSVNKYYSSVQFTTDYNLTTKWMSLGIVGTGTLHIATTGDATHTVTYNSTTGEGTVSVTISGSVTAKPDIKEGGATTVGNSSFINFNDNDFDTSVNGIGGDINLSVQTRGTTTPTAGYTAIYGTSSAAFVQRGIICMWSGSQASIPSGWQLCNGTNGTPDLRDRFVIGAGLTYTEGVTGGTSTHTHTENSHTHNVDPPSTASGNTTNYNSDWGSPRYSYEQNHQHYTDIASFSSGTGSSTINFEQVLPPYYALCYIMKM